MICYSEMSNFKDTNLNYNAGIYSYSTQGLSMNQAYNGWLAVSNCFTEVSFMLTPQAKHPHRSEVAIKW